MDTETLTLLGESVLAWCRENEALIQALETQSCDSVRLGALYETLGELGLTTVLGETDTHDEIQAVAEIAWQLARYSPSIAVMVVQQNLAGWLLAESGAGAAAGWVALPLFDAVAEWAPSPLQAVGAATLSGCWTSLPLLPLAQQVLLPLAGKDPADFALVALPVPAKNIQVSAPVKKLGLRGCPQADLHVQDVALADSNLIMRGADAARKIETLWSQAEACMMAIRAGIADASYSTARDYAAQRYQGGKIIIRHSLIRKMLADFYREKCVLNEQWQNIASGLRPGEKLSAGQMGMALNSGRLVPLLASDGIQLLGGVGYMEDYPQERRFRDAKHCEFLLGHPQARNFSLWNPEAEWLS